jgi:hypothetical protein
MTALKRFSIVGAAALLMGGAVSIAMAQTTPGGQHSASSSSWTPPTVTAILRNATTNLTHDLSRESFSCRPSSVISQPKPRFLSSVA